MDPATTKPGPRPDFSDRTLFPNFARLPTVQAASASSASASGAPKPPSYWLVAQVKENMTITKPTLVAMDLSGFDFALTFEDTRVDVRPFKKGSVIVMPDARRKVNESAVSSAGSSAGGPGGGGGNRGQMGFVWVAPDKGDGGAKGLAGSLDTLKRLAKARGHEGADVICSACGKGPAGADASAESGESVGEGELKRCTGCGAVSYCNKACQATAWSEMGHKADCKVLRGMIELWG